MTFGIDNIDMFDIPDSLAFCESASAYLLRSDDGHDGSRLRSRGLEIVINLSTSRLIFPLVFALITPQPRSPLMTASP